MKFDKDISIKKKDKKMFQQTRFLVIFKSTTN